ncbi:MAG: band 7 protein [Frankiales bacterium]|nr:band 7 protein [Frankiales bacterium]
MSSTEPAVEIAAVPVGHQGARVEIEERRAVATNGWLGVLVMLIGGGLAIAGGGADQPALVGVGIAIGVIVLSSLVIIPPGQTRVVQFFGRYVGTVREPGLTWVLPLTTRKGVSVRVRNFETNHLKVNDADGNPVEIAAIVVWQVADTARATFAVDSYHDFISVQSESALRHVATSHPYDNSNEDGTSLRGSTDVVAGELAREVAQRVVLAGLEIVEVRISHLAYSPEIAQAMLRRQQANAVVAARSRIVEGAVGMVRLALEQLNEQDIVQLDEERKAAMVSNLLVVLCSDQPASPIVNAGSLYS